MYMEIAIGAIGIGVMLMVGYIVIAQVKLTLPTTLNDTNLTNSMEASQATMFAGFGLLAVGVIVMAAFALINIFK